MTKKSAARLERDKAAKEMAEIKKTNKCWDELRDLSTHFSRAIVDANSQLNAVYRTEGLINYIPKKAEVNLALRGLARDLEEFTRELGNIYSLHKDRTGGFTDEEDFMQSLQIFESYTNYQTKYDGTIMPTVTFLLEQAELALQIGVETQKQMSQEQSEQAKKALVDPTVISDAVIKVKEEKTNE